MRTIFFYLLLFLGFAAYAQEQTEMQLDIGSDLSVDTLEGSVSVTCRPPGGYTEIQLVHCYGQMLTPSSWSYVSGPKGLNVNRLDLTAHHSDGNSVTKKKINYDGQAGRTLEKVNLWVGSLFQQPLLNGGLNNIDYKLKNGDDTVQKGTFQVTVKKGIERHCPFDYMTSFDEWDCKGTTICPDYFYMNNYCQ